MFAAVSMDIAEQLLGLSGRDRTDRERVRALSERGATPIGPPERNFWALPDSAGMGRPGGAAAT